MNFEDYVAERLDRIAAALERSADADEKRNVMLSVEIVERRREWHKQDERWAEMTGKEDPDGTQAGGTQPPAGSQEDESMGVQR